MSAYTDIMKVMQDDEKIEGIVFGPWGWGDAPDEGEEWEQGYGEPNPPLVPFSERGKVLTLEEATPYMEGWEFNGGFGAPECYATYIWTNKRVLWVTQYDGATALDAVPRHPEKTMPDMSGG